MNISAEGLHLIAGFEGFRPSWYRDLGGVETIGYGHTGSLPAGYSAPLTAAAGLELLKHDTAGFAESVTHDVKVSLGVVAARAQCRFDALCCLAYNIGAGALGSSSLLREINARPAPRDWADCGPLWLEWDHVGSAVVPGLLARRRQEFAIFRAGAYPKV